MTMKPIPVIFSVLILCVCTCSTRKDKALLYQVECMMEEKPDSALTILRGMSNMPSRRMAAKQAILHSRALDKCWIDLTTDSIIAPAVEYYRAHGSVEEKIMMYHYLGKIEYNAGNYQSAIVSQMHALKLAEKHNLVYWKAMTFSALGFILNANYDVSGELDSFEKAYRCWIEYGDSAHISKAIFSLATAYQNNGKPQEADSLYRIICDRGDYEAYIYRATNLMRQPDPDYKAAIEFYDMAVSHNQSLRIDDYYLYALALSLSGDSKRANNLLQRLSGYPINEHGYYSRYRIYRQEGRYKEAMMSLAQYTSKSDSIVRVQLNQSVNKAKSDYNEMAAKIAEEQNRNTHIFLFLVVTVLIMLYVISHMRLRIRHVKIETERAELNVLYDEALRMLETAKEREQILQKQANESMAEVEEKMHGLRCMYAKMYQSQFAEIRRILERPANSQDVFDMAKNRYAEKVQMVLSEIRSSKTRRRKFESMLDTELEGIMTKLRTDYPALKDSDFRLLSYLIVGFDATTRSMITGTSNNYMRVTKSRLIKYIEENKTQNYELYRAFIFPGK